MTPNSEQAQAVQDFPNMDAFYVDLRRRRSPEADYGVFWYDDNPLERWRVSYVQATGEIYACRNGDTPQNSPVEVLGILPADKPDAPLGVWYTTLDKVLSDWPTHCGKPGGLTWIRTQLARHHAKQGNVSNEP